MKDYIEDYHILMWEANVLKPWEESYLKREEICNQNITQEKQN